VNRRCSTIDTRNFQTGPSDIFSYSSLIVMKNSWFEMYNEVLGRRSLVDRIIPEIKKKKKKIEKVV
jgi:hypothetical protein